MADTAPPPPRSALLVEHQLAQSGRLSHYLVHELNNQLAGVLGYAQLLLQKPETAPFARQLERMLAASERAQQLIEDFRAATHLHAEPEPVTLGEALRAALRAREYQFTKRNVQIIPQIAADLPTHMLNPGHVQLALGALLDNAYEALEPRKSGTVEVSVTRTPADGTAVEISDNGDGVPPDHAVWSTTKDPKRHAGLGLAVATWVAEACGGRCEIAASAKGGARIRWEVPPTAPADPAAA